MAKSREEDAVQAAYVAVPPTPQAVDDNKPTDENNNKKLTLAERYAQEPPFSERENPLDRASLLSRIAIHWMQPLISLGATKPLEQQDIWRICDRDSCDALETRFRYWYHDNAARVRPPKWFSRFGLSLLLTFRRDLAVVMANYLVYLTAMVLQPFLTQAILNHLNNRPNSFHISNGYVLVVLMALVSVVGVTCLNYGVFLLSRVGANMRSVIMNAVYQKALTLSSAARQSYTTGEIMTLMSVDTERIFSANISLPWLVIAPLAFVLTCVMVAAVFDVVAALCGALLLVAIVATSLKLAHKIGRVQSQLMRVVEERVKVTSETLQGIRVMKFYAWEESLAARVERIRAREMVLFRKFHFLSITNSVLLFLTPVLLGALVLGIYIWRKSTMTVTDAFTLIAMVNITRLAVSLFPLAISSGSQARIAFQRIDKYMESTELDTAPLAIEHEAEQDNKEDVDRGSIRVRNATFQWGDALATASDNASTTSVPEVVVVGEKAASTTGDDASSDSFKKTGFSLEDVDLEIAAGSLVMIVGTVGAGKTSLLSAILGEMAMPSGTCDVRGDISYVSQEAWIRNSSVKDNILFEAPFDSARYEQVLEATQLALDLHALPDGDATEIGERGINLSGGQKARVAIARAMYRRDYDILVLDDPLSAVDPHVAHAIFDHCIVGLAHHKTRLLVLNSHYDLLPHADQILVVEHGRVVGNGTFHEVITQFPDLDMHKQELERLEHDEIDEHETREIEERKNHEAAHAAATAADATVEDAVVVSQPTTESSAVKPSSAKLVQDEDRVKGRVSGSTYQSYFNETGFNGWLVVAVIVTIYAVAQGLRISADYWQGYWAKQMPRKGKDPTYSQHFYLSWYFTFIATCIVLTFARGYLMIEACMRSAQNLHDDLFRRVLRAPVNRYFDITPVGRILNRFSNDLDQVDANLPQQYQGLVESLASFFGSLVVCAFASLWIAVSYLPMLLIFVLTGLYFKRTSREVKRLEGITRTPVFNLFGETLNGLATIRAFQMQRDFVRINKRVVDRNASFYLQFWCTGRWLAIRLDWLSVLIIVVVSLYVVASKNTIAPIVAGLSITYSLQLTSLIQWCVRSMDMTDNSMTSVERLLAFRDVPTERDDGMPVNTSVWPSVGAVHFDKLCLKYRPELPLVLRGVEMAISGGDKVGICGRTGAGKSSLMIALFRICEFESGTVRIDGVDIATLPLRDLRRALAIIPQDPVLYSGSLRENLDPFGEYSDDAIWRVLEQVHLADPVGAWGAGLDFIVSERGDNLSVGQRQLLCIGRALLKDSKIVVLDEATANVDTATDTLIQTTIKETFQDKTVLIIAHRIHTILHCNKIAVMDAGQVAEFGSPAELLARPESIFASLAKRSTQQ